MQHFSTDGSENFKLALPMQIFLYRFVGWSVRTCTLKFCVFLLQLDANNAFSGVHMHAKMLKHYLNEVLVLIYMVLIMQWMNMCCYFQDMDGTLCLVCAWISMGLSQLIQVSCFQLGMLSPTGISFFWCVSPWAKGHLGFYMKMTGQAFNFGLSFFCVRQDLSWLPNSFRPSRLE